MQPSQRQFLITLHGFYLLASSLMPIFHGYLAATIALVMIVKNPKSYLAELFPRSATGARENHGAQLLRWLLLATVILTIFQLVSTFGAALTSSYSQGIWLELKKFSHTFTKFAVLPATLVFYLPYLAKSNPRALRQALQSFAIFMALYLLYCLIQRQTGIDLVRGLSARLGPGRFDHGVFRISGLMSHPLTLAYNLLLIFVTSLVLTKHARSLKLASLWLLCSCSGAILLLSGSRFPIIMMIFCLLAFLLVELPLKKIGKILPIIVLGLAVILLWEGNFLGRLQEFGKSGLMRVLDDRPMFWQAHLHMFQDHPIFGVGLSGYEQAKTAYYEALQYHDKMYQAHNHYLQYLADSGLVGFLGLMTLVVMLWFAGYRQYDRYRNIHLLLLAATITLAGLIQNVVRDSEFLYAFWTAIALTLSLQDGNGARKQQPQDYQPGARPADSSENI